MLRITASGLERVRACPPSASLPMVSLRSASPEAERGTIIHRYIERVLKGEASASALAGVPEDIRETCAQIDVPRAVSGLAKDLRTEVAMHINVYSLNASDLGSGQERRYPTPALGDIFGTTDVAGRREWDGMPVVIDWKTGYEEVTACRDNLQMQFAATAHAILLGAPESEARIGYVRPSGRIDWDVWTFTTFDLDANLDELYATYKAALHADDIVMSGGTPPVFPGDHCTYCPALTGCPAHTALARSMLGDITEIQAQVQALSPEQAGQAWRKLRSFKRLAETVGKSLRMMAIASPLPVDDEHEIRETHYMQRSFDPARAMALLREKGATAEEIASCEPRVQRSRVDEFKKRKV